MELDYRSFEEKYGVMYHLLINKINDPEGVKYVSGKDKGVYASVSSGPIFFNWDKEFRVALDYTIIYPKIYVRTSALLRRRDILNIVRSAIN